MWIGHGLLAETEQVQVIAWDTTGTLTLLMMPATTTFGIPILNHGQTTAEQISRVPIDYSMFNQEQQVLALVRFIPHHFQ